MELKKIMALRRIMDLQKNKQKNEKKKKKKRTHPLVNRSTRFTNTLIQKRAFQMPSFLEVQNFKKHFQIDFDCA